MTAVINQVGSRLLQIHDNGFIERITDDGFRIAPSASWQALGAVRYNNFGRIVEWFSLADVLTKPIQWQYKNGKQRVHIVDLDHGAIRVWMSPRHHVVPWPEIERIAAELDAR